MKDIPVIVRILEDFFKKVLSAADDAANSAVKAEEAAQRAREYAEEAKRLSQN